MDFNVFQINDNCERAMNTLLEELREETPAFEWEDIFDAFDEADKEDYVYGKHLMTALKYNSVSTVKDLLDVACACDFLIEHKGEYIAIDWTSNESAIEDKVYKHIFLKPIYEYLGIEKTLVVRARKCFQVRTKQDFINAKANAVNAILSKIDKMSLNNEVNSKLTITINTSI